MLRSSAGFHMAFLSAALTSAAEPPTRLPARPCACAASRDRVRGRGRVRVRVGVRVRVRLGLGLG